MADENTPAVEPVVDPVPAQEVAPEVAAIPEPAPISELVVASKKEGLVKKVLSAAELFGITIIEDFQNGYKRFKAEDWSGNVHEFIVKAEALAEKIEHTAEDDVKLLFEHWKKKHVG